MFSRALIGKPGCCGSLPACQLHLLLIDADATRCLMARVPLWHFVVLGQAPRSRRCRRPLRGRFLQHLQGERFAATAARAASVSTRDSAG
ncbi:MAG TPA: hypothetical protein VEY92_04900 [Pseudoxanthomonas sp.]|nr:hypothetical protein [Pseudoxanthomonas sp.]